MNFHRLHKSAIRRSVAVTAALLGVVGPKTKLLAGTATTYTFTQLANFSSFSPILNPEGDLVTDSAGNIYGTGNDLFELPVANRTPVAIAQLNSSTTGADPYAGLLIDPSGDLYGTAYYGGASGFGTIFELPANTSTPVLLATFNGTTTGGLSRAKLIMDNSGNLYGTTSYGGANSGGTVFELPSGSHTIQTLVNLNSSTGTSPQSGLTFDAAGNMFGTTSGGGTYGDGTIYEISAATHNISTILNFNGSNGAHPDAGLYRDASGNFYGTTSGGQGGAYGYGTVYELSSGDYSLETLAVFSGSATGSAPSTDVIMDASGDLFGTAGGGPSLGGTIWELPAGSNTIDPLIALNTQTGADPDGGLAIDSAGDLFGTAYQNGGPGPQGSVFELSPVTVPEPAACSFLAMAALFLSRRRHRVPAR